MALAEKLMKRPKTAATKIKYGLSRRKSMTIKDFDGAHIGNRVIKADRKGKAKIHLLSADYQTEIEIDTAILLHNGVCPDCKYLLESGIGTNGEYYIACDACGFFSE